MIWRLGTGFVVGETWFQVVDATGAVSHRFNPSEWSIEYDLASTVFLVRDGRLIERTVIEHFGGERPDTVTETVLFEGLVEDRSEETARFVATALGDNDVIVEERRLREEREAEARVDAVEGSRERMPQRWENTRLALVERIYRWGDERAAELLRTLIDLVRAETREPALAAYVRGCLLACFFAAPPLVEDDPMPSPFAARVAELAERVHRDAEYQSEIDASANARELRAAAEALRASARMLGG